MYSHLPASRDGSGSPGAEDVTDGIDDSPRDDRQNNHPRDGESSGRV